MLLFEPRRVGNLETKNRLMRSATAERLVDKSGGITDGLIACYKRLAESEVGTIITGYTSIHPRGRSGWQMMSIDHDDFIKGLQRLTKTVHEYEARILVQLCHSGRYAPSILINARPLAVSVSPEDMKGDLPPSEATDKEIEEVINAFAQSAYRAREAGFDGVQIHGAHGYLVSQFLSPAMNKRTDQWGGNVENRARFLKEVIQRIRQKVGTDYPIWLKLNCEDFIPNGLTLADSISTIQNLKSNNALPDAIEISGGCTFPEVIRKDILSPEKEAYFLPQAKQFRKEFPNLPLILVGGLRTRGVMEKVLGEEKMDLVSMSRPFIRNPGFALELKKGGKQSDCISCNLCLGAKKEPVRCRATDEAIAKVLGK
ncbi:MAG: NADH:flavin oxidoreductase [Planctomycetes bacterium]|nr:NADH:flavin oxidoreductase [Planctomycetota bacterium]